MENNERKCNGSVEPGKGRKADEAQASPAHFRIKRLPAALLLVVAGAVVALWMTGCAGHRRHRRPRPEPSPVPTVPTTVPPAVRWEKGRWWGDHPGERTSVSISNIDAQTVILGSAVASRPELLTVRDLSLAAPASNPLTLVLVKTGTDHPLHVLRSCSIQTNTTISVNNAALVVDGSFRVGGKLNLAQGHVAANSELLIGGSEQAPAEVHIRAGTLTVTNEHHDAKLIICLTGRGNLHLDGGTIEADLLQVVSNRNSRFIFNSGTLKTRTLSVTNYGPCTIGDGVHPALFLPGDGTNVISSLLTVTNYALLLANGNVTLTGPVANYGVIAAGQPGAQLTFSNWPPFYPSRVTNWGRIFMTNGGTITFQGTVTNYVPAPITAMQPTTTGAGWTVRFLSIGGLKHVLEYKSALGEPNWTPLATATGTGETVSLTDPAPTDKARYYHIRVTQP
jgi:hypothetical protein